MAEKVEARKSTAPAASSAAKPAAGSKPAVKSVTGSKPAQPEKAKGKVSGGAVFSVLLIVLMIAAGAVIYFNVGGVRQQLADILQTEEGTAADEALALDAQAIEQRKTELDAQAADLEKEKASLKSRTDKVKEREQAINDNEKALEERETALTKREAAVTTAELGLQESQQKQSDLAATAKIIEAMDPAVAATAISGLSTVEDMVSVLSLMSSKKTADILGHMEVKLATKVISKMMK